MADKPTYQINDLVDAVVKTMSLFVTDKSTANGTGLKLMTDIIALFRYVSPAQTITAASLKGPLAHGLGIKPTNVSGYIKCLVAEHGYSIGDEVEVSIVANGGNTAARAHGVYTDATNINMRISSATNAFLIGHKTTGAASLITNANWELYIRAQR